MFRATNTSSTGCVEKNFTLKQERKAFLYIHTLYDVQVAQNCL